MAVRVFAVEVLCRDKSIGVRVFETEPMARAFEREMQYEGCRCVIWEM